MAPPDYRLLNSQKAKVFELVTEAGLPPSDFDWRNVTITFKERSPRSVPALVHKLTSYRYIFDHRDGVFCATYSPAAVTHTDRKQFGDWDGQATNVTAWLFYLRRELEAGDPWNDLQQLPPPRKPPELPPTEVSPEERKQLLTQLAEVRQLVEAREELAADQRSAMLVAIDEIKSVLADASRSAWHLVVWGAIAEAIATQVLTPENGKWLLIQLSQTVEVLRLLGTEKVGALLT
jgi:hypothetical protein